MKQYDKIEKNMFAPCGINCIACYRHLREKKPCKGCLNSDENKPKRCIECLIKTCAKEKEIRYCFECSDFPCKNIKNLERSYIKRYKVSLIQNSTTVKNQGLEYFLLEDKERWTCKKCNGIISMHDAECSECHLKI